MRPWSAVTLAVDPAVTPRATRFRSRTITRAPRSASRTATDNPATPPPTTTTSARCSPVSAPAGGLRAVWVQIERIGSSMAGAHPRLAPPLPRAGPLYQETLHEG